MADKPLLLLDTASLYYRSYFAMPSSMTAPDGHPNGAIRGLLGTVGRLVQTHAPGALVACWDDDWRPQWRVDLLPTYKTHRLADDTGDSAAGADESEPEHLGPQVDAIAGLLDALGLARWGVPGFEADDVIGTAATIAPGRTIVVSGDRDLVQLVDAHTHLLLTVNGGMEKWPLLDPQSVLDRFGVEPDRYVDLAVLRGDPSDGIPGVPGIGAKTAAALVTAFGDCTGIRLAASQGAGRPMTPRLAAAIEAAADYLDRAVQVAMVARDLPLPELPSGLPRAPADAGALADLAQRWGVSRQVADLQGVLAAQMAPE